MLEGIPYVFVMQQVKEDRVCRAPGTWAQKECGGGALLHEFCASLNEVGSTENKVRSANCEVQRTDYEVAGAK